MKDHIIKFLGAATIVLNLMACDSFLDEQPRGYAIPETTENYEGMFNTIAFMNVSCEDYTKFLSPHIIITPENVSAMYRVMSKGEPASAERAFKFQTDIYEPSENCQLWAYIYEKIYIFNSIINGVMSSTGGTKEEKQAIQAEARIGRAWLHFILAQAFSKPYNATTPDELTIPIVKEADTYAENFRRATMKDFYDFVATEMDEAVPQMKDLPLHRMRAYKTTGLALQGKMYWIMGEYEKALSPLREAYQRITNDTETTYLRNYNTLLAEKYGNRELSITEMRSENKTNGSCLLPYAWADPQLAWVKQNPCFSGIFGLAYYNACPYYITPEEYDKFDEYDLRRNLIPTVDISGIKSVYPAGGVSDYCSNYGLRLSEIYVALAECEARVGSEANARSVLTDLRSYRVLTGHEHIPETVRTKDDLIRFCVDEQDRELMADIISYYNVRRLWNDPLFQDHKPYTHTDGTNTYTMREENFYLRLPESVLKWNESWRKDEDQK